MTALTEVGEAQLIRTGGENAEIIFDLVSKAETDIGVAALFLRVLNFLPLHFLQDHPYAGVAKVRKYSCEVREEAKLYECTQRSPGYDYIRLSSGELERVQIAVSADVTGLYEMVVAVQCSIDGKLEVFESEEIKVGIKGRDHDPAHVQNARSGLLAPDVKSRLIEILRHSKTAEHRHVAAVALAEFAVPEAIDGLRDALRDRKFHDVRRAVKLLADYRDPRANEVLEDIINDDDGYFHDQAAAALRWRRRFGWRSDVNEDP